MVSNTNKIISAVVAIAVILAIIVLIYVNLPKQTPTDNDTDDDQAHKESPIILSLIYNDETQNYTYGQLERLESYTAKGGYRTSGGSIKGVGNYTGVNMSTLINLLEVVEYRYSLEVTDLEGNSTLYNFSTITGDVNIYNPTNASDSTPIGKGNMTMVLAYQFEGNLLNQSKDGKLKIVFLDQNGSITESILWWKKVVSIHVITE
jgi:hypothetical protein